MNDNWNYERRPRLANAVKWDLDSTNEVMTRLAKHGITGELLLHTDGIQYMTIRKNGWIVHTLRHGDHVFIGEDGCLRFLGDEAFRSKYQPIVKNDDLEQLRACEVEWEAAKLQDLSEKIGITFESLKAAA